MAATLSQIIEAPQAGQTVIIYAGSLRTLAFAFTLADAVVERSGGDYAIRLPNGGVIILRGMPAGEEYAPTILLPDGSGIPFSEALRRMGFLRDASGRKIGEEDREDHGAEEKNPERESSEANAENSRNADAGSDASQQNASRNAETPAPNPPVQSQGGSDSGSGSLTAGSGVGEFRSDAMSLVDGIWALPDQETHFWGWSNDKDPRQDGLAIPESSGPGYVPGTSIILSGATVNESENYATFTVEVTAKTGPGTLVLALTGGNAVAGTDYSTALEYFVNGGWEPVPVDADGNFVLPVTGNDSLTLRLPIMDNHLENGGTAIGLSVVELTGQDGSPLTDYTNDTRLSCHATITDDSQASGGTPGIPHEKDGPLVSITRTSTDEILFESPAGTHTFRLELNDCISGNDYCNPDGSGELLQDITISLQAGGRATLGTDYALQVSGEMQALIDAGKMTVSGLQPDGTILPGADGKITVTLHGQHASDGSPNTGSGKVPLTETEFADLLFEAVITPDGVPEVPENIRLTILDVHGNEAQIGTDMAEGKIADDATRINGPKLSWTSDTSSVSESAPSDPVNAPANNTNLHTIKLDVAAPEPIRVIIQLAGNDGAVLFNGSNAENADFAWAGVVEYSTNGIDYFTLGQSFYTYNPATGKCELTIPEDAVNVRFAVTIYDDMREADESGENYDVTLSLVVEGGMADGDARLDGAPVDGSLTHTAEITPDAVRPAGSLNPPSYDGPFVVLEANATGLTDDGSGGCYAPESGNVSLPFTLSLRDPGGSGTLFTGSEESVTVTLTISGGAGFQVQDLFAPSNTSGAFSGSIPYTIHYDDGTTATGTLTLSDISAGVNAYANSLDFQLSLPPGANTVTFHLPVNDDPLGGTSSADSSIERAEETVTVTIKNVSGNEARVDTSPGGGSSDSQVIRDDAAGDGFEGIQVGLGWKSGVTDGVISEGVTGVIALKLFDATGANALSSANTPYGKYTGSTTTLPEDLKITMNFTDTGDGGDLALKFSSEFLGLVTAGKVVVSIGGTEYNAAQLASMTLDGEFTVTLKSGTGGFDFAADAGKLTLNAHVFGDNVNEYDAVKNYADEHTTLQESFGLEITEVSGNESTVKTGAHEAEAVITDMADGKLTLSGGDLHAATDSTDGYWSFAIAVTYSDGEKTNDPASSVTSGSAPGSAVTLPGEDIVLRVSVSDGSMMQHGEEYEVSAYELFLSLNGPGAAGITEQAYLSGSYTPDAGWIIVTLVEDWDAGGGALFEFSVPREYWDTHTDGTINFTISQGEHLGGHTADSSGGFTVKLEAPDQDFKGEITEITGGAVQAKEDNAVRIEMSLDHTPVIYENANGSNSNVATYKMVFTQIRGSDTIPGDLKLACEIGFDFTFKPGTADFNENTEDNTLYNDRMGDFAISGADGTLYPYDVNQPGSLQNALQTIFDNDYGTGNVTVTVAPDGDGYKISFTIKEGVDLSQGIDLYFVAMDDNITDSNSFSAQISNVRSDGNAVDISIVGSQAGETTIRDEAGSGSEVSGFAIAIGDGVGYEKLVGADLLDGIGDHLDGKVHMPLYAYPLSNGDMPGSNATDGTILSLADLVDIYLNKGGDTSVTVGNAAESSDFREFVETYFEPTQDITITMQLADGTAGVNKDFQDQTQQTVSGPWELVIDGDHVYFKSELTVDSINDYRNMSDGEINLTVTVTGSSNNETRLVDGDDNIVTDHSLSATGTIKDFHDGPYIVSAGPANDTLYEPVDSAHASTDTYKSNPYTIQLNRATEEDTVIWLEIEGITAQEGTAPSLGHDYFLGEGVYKYNADGTCTTWNGSAFETVPVSSLNLPAGVDPSGMAGKYFVIIEADNSSVSFDINVLDDNKTELGEQLRIEVIKAEGGEITYLATVGDGADAKEYAVPWSDSVPYLYAYMDGGVRVEVLVDPVNNAHYILNGSNGGVGQKVDWADAGEPGWLPSPSEETTVTIQDDGFGPRVSVTSMTWDVDPDDGTYDDAPTLELFLQEACQQDVLVSITLTIPGVGTKTLTFTFEAGESGPKTFSADEVLAKWNATGPQMPDRGDISGSIRLTLDTVANGEAVHNGDERHLVIHHGTNPVIWLSELHISDSGQPQSGLTEHLLPNEIGDYGTITLKMDVPSAGDLTVTEDVTFTINVPASGSLGNDTATQYTVTIPKTIVEQMQAANSDVTATITLAPDPDGSGNPVLTITVGGSTTWTESDGLGLTLDGGTTLPALKGDTVIGDEGGVTCWVSENSGAYLDLNGSTVEYVPLKDNTYATIKLFIETAEGFVLLENGAELLENLGAVTVKAVLVLTDASGNMINADGSFIITGTGPDDKIMLGDVVKVTTDEALEFSIHTAGDSTVAGADDAASPGADYTASSSVRIPKGESSGEFVLNITQDDMSEGKEGFDLKLIPTQDTKNAAEEELERLTNNTGGSGEYVFAETEGVITDDDSGPVISWNVNTTSVPENGSITLTWESRQDGGRQVVVEDVEMVFELTPGGLKLDEIESITVNGTTYTGSGLASILTETGGKWLLTLAAGLNKGEGLGTLTIQLKDDVISEGTENLSFILKSVDGGETTQADETQTKTVMITETVNGPKVDLVAVSADEEDSAVVYTLELKGGSPTGENGTVVLTINEESRAFLDLTGGKIIITLPDGGTKTVGEDAGYEYDSSTGKLTVTIPAGSTGGNSFTITIPITDDALTEERNFGMAISDIDKGEMEQVAAVAYTVEFVKESAEVGGVNGYNEYVVKTGSAPDCHASLRFEVTGIASKSVIDKLYLGGKKLAEGTDWEWIDGKVVVTSEVAKMLQQYSFKITYKLAADIQDGDGAALIASTKDNIRVENPGMTDREVVIPIENETADADKDGPAVSLSLPGTVTEGGVLEGEIIITMPDLAANGDTLLEDITVTITLSPTDGFSLTTTTLGGKTLILDDSGLSGDPAQVTITIPAGTEIPPNGKLEISFEADIPDNSLSGGNPPYTVTISDITGEDGVYEKYDIDTAAGTKTVTVTDNATDTGPAASLEIGVTSVEEGAALTGTLVVQMPDLAANGDTLLEDITVTITLSPTDDFSLTTTTLGGKTLILDDSGLSGDPAEVTITIPAGTEIPPNGKLEISFEADIPDNSLSGGNPPYTVTISDITGEDGVYEKYDIDTAAGTKTVTVTDNATDTGPAASLEIGVTSVEEGAALTGTLVVQMPDLAANGDTLLEDITVTITLSPTDDFSLTTTTLGGKTLILDDSGLSGDPAEVTITIPAGTQIPAGGKFEIGFTADVPDNSLTVNDDYSVAISGLSGADGAYEKYGIAPDAQAGIDVTVTDNATDTGPTVSLAGFPMLLEAAGVYNFTIELANPAFGGPATLVENIDVTLTLTGYYPSSITIGGQVYNVNGDGTVTFTILAGTPVDTPIAASMDTSSLVNGEGFGIAVTEVTGAGGGSNTYETIQDGADLSVTVVDTFILPFALNADMDTDDFSFAASALSLEPDFAVLEGMGDILTDMGEVLEAVSPGAVSGLTGLPEEGMAARDAGIETEAIPGVSGGALHDIAGTGQDISPATADFATDAAAMQAEQAALLLKIQAETGPA